MIQTFYVRKDGRTLFVTGHFTRKEIQELKREGYQEREPQINKNGIRVEG